MNDDYLWDRTGRDPEVEGLERLLAPAALGAPRRRRSLPFAWAAGIAAAALFAVGAWQALHRAPESPPPDRDWVLQEDGRRKFDMGRYGHVLAEPGARVRVERIDEEMRKLRLDQGTIHARITKEARPRLFQVATPATTCVDLGCYYTLTVDPSGMSRVQVESGRVLFDDGRRQVFIPQGASGKAAPGRAPFTPIHDDTPQPLRAAVEAFDAAPVGHREKQAKEVSTLVRRPEDGLVAWHLLQDPEDGVVAAALTALVNLSTRPECGVKRPPEATLEAALKHDPVLLKKWRDELFPEWSKWD